MTMRSALLVAVALLLGTDLQLPERGYLGPSGGDQWSGGHIVTVTPPDRGCPK